MMKDCIRTAKTPKTQKTHKCPVCGRHEFEHRGSLDICEVCGWQDDLIQELDPNEECCANQMSLNQAREAFKKGEEIE